MSKFKKLHNKIMPLKPRFPQNEHASPHTDRCNESVPLGYNWK